MSDMDSSCRGLPDNTNGGGTPTSFTILNSSKSADFSNNRKSSLLRLLQSPMLDALMALTYLWRYNGRETGIHFLLCQRLRDMELSKVEFILPQLCHLTVCNLEESPSLEHLLFDICQRSLHAAIFTLWYFENYLTDFRETFSKNQKFYNRTVRLLQELQKVLFRENTTSFSPSEQNPTASSSIGIGLVASGCLAAGLLVPEFARNNRALLLTEARAIGYSRNKTAKAIKTTPRSPMGLNCDGQLTLSSANSVTSNFNHVSFASATSVNLNPITSVEDLNSGNAFSFKKYILDAARQIQGTTFNQHSSLGEPPIPLYYFPEMQFIMSLIDISSRLVSVPKEGRQNALKAELALIDHNLPASLCIPLWCQSVDNNSESDHHHRIIRICPLDAVVLNSAERAPFLLQIEILDGINSEEEFQELISKSSANIKRASLSRASVTDPQNTDPSIIESEASNLSVIPELPDADLMPNREIDCTFPTIMPITENNFAERMRTAAIMLAQLTRQTSSPGVTTKKLLELAAIKDRIIREMETLEKNRLLDALQLMEHENSVIQDLPANINPLQSMHFDKEDPSAAVFQESWDEKVQRLRLASPYSQLPGWKLLSLIVKSSSDIRQEQLACQIISEMTSIWESDGLPLWTYCYRVLVASSNGGLIETVPNAISIHSIKKSSYFRNKSNPTFTFSLRNHFIRTFGSPDSDSFVRAREAFTNSLAAYSIVTYILQVKDRHDGNILLDSQGHLIHIDFGFMLSNSPGYVGFESAPFKLTPEYIELMGGLHSAEFARFKELMFRGFVELRKHVDRIIVLVEIMQLQSRLPCFYGGDAVISQLRQRFHLTLTDNQLRQVVDRLVIGSAFNVFTKLYDSYQYYSNGIL